MKLRLPHKFQAALLAAIASVSFTTLSSGTLAAAFFLGNQAFADEAADEPTATIDIGDTNLDAQAAMDEEEGTGEAKEPGSTPINQAGFNGRRGSSDDADRILTVDEDGTDTGAIATGNVGAADQADSSTASSGGLGSDDLGFTATPYATGTGTANGSDSVFTETATPAAAVAATDFQQQAATQETSTTPTAYTANSTVGAGAVNLGSFGGGGGGYSLSASAMPRAAVVTVPEAFDATDPAAEAAKTDSGSADSTPADELGSTTPSISVGGASLVKATNSSPAPAMVGATGDTSKHATWNFEGNMTATKSGINSDLTPEWKGGGSESYVDTGLYIGWESGGNVIGSNLGQAVTFDGSHFIRVTSGSTFSNGGDLPLDTTHAFTVSVWVKLDNANNERFILGTGDGNNGGFSLALKDGDLDFLAKGKAHHNFTDTPDLSTGKWYNFTITSDGTKTYGYVNGESIGDQDMSGWQFVQGSNLGIGSGSANANQSNITGQIASLDIYGECLSANEVKAQYGMIALADVAEYTWKGQSGAAWENAVWSTSEADNQNFLAGSDAVFGADGNNTVNVTSTTGAHNAEVTGDYTFNLADGITFSTYALTVNDGSSLTLTGGSAEVALNSLSGSGSLTFNSTGTAQLLGSSADYSGNVAIKDGTVAVKAQDALGTGTVTVEGGTLETHVALGKAITLSGGTLAGAGSNATYSGAITVSAASTIMTASSQTVTVSGLVSGSGSLTVDGTGTALLSGNNTGFTGDVIVKEGTLKVGHNIALGTLSGTRKLTIQTGGTLDVNGKEGNAAQDFFVELAGGTLANSAGGLTYGTRQFVTSVNVTADSTIQADNMFGFTAGSYNPITIAFTDGTTLEKKGTADFVVTKATITGNGTFKVSAGKLKFQHATTSSANFIMNGGEVAVGQIAAANYTLSGNITITTTADSVFSLPLNTNGHTITFDGSAALTVSGAVSGTGSLVVNGGGTVTLNGANTFSGNLDISGATVVMGNQNALGSSNAGTARTITIGENATVDINGTYDVCYAYTLNGGTLLNNGTSISDNKRQTMGLNLLGDSYIGGSGNFDILNSNGSATTVSLNNNTLTKTGSNRVRFYNTTFDTAGTLEVKGGTLWFQSGDSFNGATKIVLDDAAAGTGAAASLQGGSVNVNADMQIDAKKTAESSLALALNNSTLTANVATGKTLTMSGALTGNGGITKNGTGTVTLSGANTYTGGTTVSAGTLAASNASALGTGAVNVTGGTLELTSTVNAGALTMSSGTIKLANGVTYASSGAISLTSGTLDVTGMSFQAGSSYTLATASGGVSCDNVTLNYTLPTGATSYTLSSADNALTLTFNGAPEPAPLNIGKWMAIGDSISHGTHEYSYRWGLQKAFTDNGISFDAIGVQKSTFYMDETGPSSYGGSAFDNEHCAQFNVWASEIAGKSVSEDWYHADYGSGQTSLWYSNVKNWLGLSTELTGGQGTYPNSNMGARGTTFTGENAPDTYTVMLGTNDLNKGRSNADILGDIATILQAAQDRAAIDGNATVYLMSVPYTKNTLAKSKIDSYNAALQEWIAANKGNYANLDIRYANINDGFYDVTGSTAGGGVSSMLQDWAHPTAQGNLIISGNLAKAMGYAGRTAGQFRKAAGEFSQHAYAGGFSELPSGATNVTLSGNALNFGASGASTLSLNWDGGAPTGGYTVDFSLLLGDGASNNWDTSTNFSVNLGNGTLNVNEAYIQWGSTILYSRDASTTANLRVAYVQGDTANNLAAGYYVWLGDQLIGEACTASGSVANAVTFSYSGSGNALLKSLAMDSTGSWAPTTNLTEGDDGYHANPFVDGFRISTRQGEGDFSQANVGATAAALADGIISGKRKGGNYYYANFSGDSGYLGNCHVWSFEKANQGSNSLYYVTYGLGNGSTAVTARLAGANMTFNTLIGLYNSSAATMGADILTQLDSVGGTYGAYHGSERMGSTAKVALTMNEGTISGDVVGGFAVVANNSQTIASTEININSHGVVGGNVYGGSTANGTVTNAKVTITGGRIGSDSSGGNVYGGGTDGTVGTATVEITGGEIFGSVYGGGNGGTVDSSSVTVKTYVPYIHGDIDADSVTISDLRVAPDADQNGFDKYTGTITADTITLYNDTTFSADAHLVTQTLKVQHNSSVTIHDLQLTACAINVDDTSVATLDGTLTLGNVATYTGTLNLADGLSIDVSALDFGDMTQDVTLLSTTSGSLGSTNVKNITLDFGESQEPSYYNLVKSGENLMLTFVEEYDGLIWNGPSGTWSSNDANWHTSDQPTTSVVFETGKNVRFASESNGNTVTLGESITAGEMTIDKDVAVTINPNSNTLQATLKGEGTYVLPNGEKSMPNGVKLGSDWTGAVRLSGTGSTALSFNNVEPGNTGLATQNSAIELNGVAGWVNTGLHDANIRLVNNVDTAAIDITDGSSEYATTLSGDITGDGTFKISWGGGSPTFNFTGDLSGWTGDFNKTGGNTSTLNLTDNGGSAIAPDIKNTGSGTLNVNINNSNAVTLTDDFTKTSGTLNLNVGNVKATNATFQGGVTATTLAVNSTSTATFAGGTGNLGNITLTGNNNNSVATTLRFSPDADSSTGSYTASTITMSGNGNAGLKWVVVDQNASLELTGTNVGSGGGSSIANAWGVSGGGLEVNGILTSAGTISMDGPGSSTFKGAGQINAAGLNISNGNTATIQGGVKINITSGTGIYKRDGYASTLNLADATLQAKTVDWELKNSVENVNLTNSDTGTTFEAAENRTITVSKAMGGAGKLVKTGDGTLTLNTANNYGGGTDVNAGTLVVSNASGLGTGAVTLNSGTLDLTTGVTTGNLTMSGGTLKLSGANQLSSASLTLGSASWLDITNVSISGTADIVLASTTNGITGEVSSLQLTGQVLPEGWSLAKSGSNLVLTFTQPSEWPAGSHVRYTYTPAGATEAEVHYDIQSGTAPHGYNFSQANDGVVEFNPALFTDANNHTYTDDEKRNIQLHSNTTFIVEEGNTVHLGAATVIGNDNTDHGDSGTFIKDGGGTMELALNSSVITVKNPGGSDFQYNKYEGSVIVKDGTLRILQNATGDTTNYHSAILAHEGDFLEVYKDATLVLDPNTKISIPAGNENQQGGRVTVVLSAGTEEAVLRNVVLDESGIRPQDDADGARASVTGDDLNISNINDLQHKISINAADITVNSFTLTGASTIDDSHITVKGEAYITNDSSVPTKIQNNSVVDVQTDYMAMLQNADVDKTSKINASGGVMRALMGSIKVEVGSSDGGVAVRTDQANTVTYTSDQLAGWQGESWGSPLSLSLTLSDMNLPVDPTNYTFQVILTDFDSSALGILPDADPVPLGDNLNVDLFVPQYADQSEMLATMKVQYTGGNTVFIFEGVRVPEPTTGTLSLLALAALAARRRRK